MSESYATTTAGAPVPIGPRSDTFFGMGTVSFPHNGVNPRKKQNAGDTFFGSAHGVPTIQRGRSNSAPTTPSEIDVAKSGKKEQTNSLFRTESYVEKKEKILRYVENSLIPKDGKDLPTITRESPF